MIGDFMKRVKNDPRVSRAHISIYVSLWQLWVEAGEPAHLAFFRNDIKDMCKVTSLYAFYKAIGELDEFGYIEYSRSVNHNKGSLVRFSEMKSGEPLLKRK